MAAQVNHDEIMALVKVLEDERDAHGLLSEVLLEVSFALHQRLPQFGVQDDGLIRRFVAALSGQLVQLHQQPGRRTVVLATGLAVIETSTADVLHPARWQASGPYAGETAVAVVNTGRPNASPVSPWVVFSAAEWHIMVLEWLSRCLAAWRDDQGDPIVTREQARNLARVATRVVPSQVNLLRVALLDALGCPRDLVAYLLRRAIRVYPVLSPSLEKTITACWSGRRFWPGMSAKLFPLAAVATTALGCASLQADHVRQCFVSHGLSRNGWAHLMRLPSDVLLALAILLMELPDNARRAFLEELSFWLSRFGNRYRYYRAERERVFAALVWLVYEVTMLRTGASPGNVRLWVLPMNVFRASVILERLAINPHQHYARFRLLMLALAHQIMDRDVVLIELFDQLVSLMDWFMEEGERFPERWFSRSFSKMLVRSDHWHEEQVALMRQQDVQRQRERALEAQEDAIKREEKERRLIWAMPVMELEHEGVQFSALDSVFKLKAEGALMEHCVESYASQCKRGNTLIYAVSRNGQRLGTLELYRKFAQNWSVVQFKGYRNTQLMPLVRRGGELAEAVGRLLAEVRKGG